MVAESPADPNILKTGMIIDGKWRIKALLGKGACGVVYKVEDKHRRGYYAAMKVEHVSPDFDQTLRLEIGVLNKLKNHKDMLKLLDYGKRKTFTYMVTTICGKDLMALRCKIKRGFTDSSALRIGVFTLYSLKQVHEAGYVHRDVKPGNVITAANNGRYSRFFYLIDFGMARSYVSVDGNGRKTLRMMRRGIPLRGTIRYCSLNVHDRLEHGRCDDLIAMIYMLVEVTLGVPWHNLKDEKEVCALKKSTTDAILFEDLPEELNTIYQYLKTLNYHDRPSYIKIYTLLMNAIKRLKINFLDPYDWEDEEIERNLKLEKELEAKEKEKATTTAEGDSGVTAPITGTEILPAVAKKVSNTNTAIPTPPITAISASSQNNNITVDSTTVSTELSREKIPSPPKPLKVEKAKSKRNSVMKDVIPSPAQPIPPVTPVPTLETPPAAKADPGSSKKEKTQKGKAVEENELLTAIDYEINEFKTKKALPREDLQFHVYPAVAPASFSETTMSF